MLRAQWVEGMVGRAAGVGHRGRESYSDRIANTDRSRAESWSHTENIRRRLPGSEGASRSFCMFQTDFLPLGQLLVYINFRTK